MSEDLQAIRKEIADVDAQMAELFVRRMRLAQDVAAYKKTYGLPILDAEQEARVLERGAERVPDAQIGGYYRSFLQGVMDLSKQYQRRLTEGVKVAYNGVPGAFAHIAAGRIFPDAVLTPFGSFRDAYSAAESGACDYAVIPIENSYAGEVGPAMDLMFDGELYVTGVYTLPITQNLLGVCGSRLAEVRRVVSHPQAISQCETYIKRHGWEVVTAQSTAAAAKQVADANDPSTAAIASAETAALYGLETLDHDINESNINTTKFAVFTRVREDRRPGGEDSFILMFTANDVAGSLAKAINVISDYGFNMKTLRSRPVKEKAWEYYFYVVVEGDVFAPRGQRMLDALSGQCQKLKVVGHYTAEKDLKEGKTV
jgi:chorismate mutase/prephenate dehydratase